MNDIKEVHYLTEQDIQDQIDQAGYNLRITQLEFTDISYVNNTIGQIVPAIIELILKKSLKFNASFYLITVPIQILIEEHKKTLTSILTKMQGHSGIKVTTFYKYDGYRPGSSYVSYTPYKMEFVYY